MAAKLVNRKGVLNNMWDDLPMDEEPTKLKEGKTMKKAREDNLVSLAVKQKETAAKAAPAAKGKDASEKSKGSRLEMKDILNKKERVAISLTGNTKKKLEKIAEENGISISSAIQLIILSYNENPTHYYQKESELLSDVEKVTDFDSLSFSDIGKRTRLKEEDKRMTSQYTLAPAIDKLIAEKTTQFGLPLKMRSRVYNAIIDKYLEVKNL